MKTLAVLLTALLAAFPTTAQDDCGSGLPCGPLPWPMPQLPALNSPTPFPTVLYQATATPTPSGPTPTPTQTYTPSATLAPTQPFDIDEIQDRVNTLEAIVQATNPVSGDIDGGVFDLEASSADLGVNAGGLFGYIRGLTNGNMGFFQQFLQFVLLALVFTLVIKSGQFFIPVAAMLFGFVRRIVQFILDFIPG